MNDPLDAQDQAPPPRPGTDAGWERDLLTRLAFAAVKEQRRARRWGIFFKLCVLAYLLLLLVLYLPPDWLSLPRDQRHTALVDISGMIAPGGDASADLVATGLRAAFEDEATAGVIIRINSPGGSPVQADYINDEIKRLRAKHPTIPVYAVIQDMCASGGYYVAAAADKIYADKASLVGSIGVLINGFGFVRAMDKLGIERRLLTAGDNKGLLDPFLPLREEDVAHTRAMLTAIHQQFIDVVKAGRRDRLVDDPEIFSGLVWTGEQSLKLGLIDALGSAGYVAREIIGAEDIVDYTRRGSWLTRLGRTLGASMAAALAQRMGLEGLVLR